MGEDTAQRKEGEENKDIEIALVIRRVTIWKKIQTGSALILDWNKNQRVKIIWREIFGSLQVFFKRQNFLMIEGAVSRQNKFSDFGVILAKAVQQQPDRDVEEQVPRVDTIPSHFKISLSKIFCT